MHTHDANTHYSERLKLGDSKYIYDPVVENHLRKYFNGKKCLDLGCGSGYYLKMMPTGSAGFDASDVNVEYGVKHGLDIRKCNIDDWKGDSDSFDLIFASHIIEHLLSPVKFIEHCRASLKVGDYYIVGVPTEHSIDRIKWAYGFNDEIRHFYSFSPNNLRYLLERHDFVIEDRYISYMLMGTLKSSLIEKTLQRFVPFGAGILLSKGYYFVCRAI